jgi:hypothetical protein
MSDRPEDRSQQENLLAMAKMVRDYAIADGMHEAANASLEEIAECLKDYVLPKYGQKAKGRTTH